MKQDFDANLDRFADMIEPAFELMSDPVMTNPPQGITRAQQLALAIKNRKEAVRRLLAASEGVPAEEYDAPPSILLLKLLKLFSQPEVSELFGLRGQKTEGGSSGSATENITENDAD
ncbi:MAG: hypothetical protein IKD93_02530 [Firmicutes bacterium]|nr:hypothetical protein [Bacillota bacterium]